SSAFDSMISWAMRWSVPASASASSRTRSAAGACAAANPPPFLPHGTGLKEVADNRLSAPGDVIARMLRAAIALAVVALAVPAALPAAPEPQMLGPPGKGADTYCLV